MPLHIHRAERADILADGLAGLLATPLPDPFAAEVVAVPAKGVERWLTQRLSSVLGVSSSSDGVAANIQFPSPSGLVAAALAAASEVRPEEDPWAPERVVWTLLRVIDDALGEPWCAVLARHLGAHDTAGRDHRVGRRYATAAQLASLFDSYAAQRPGLVIEWAAGRDTDGAGNPVPDDLRWQPELWRRLRAEVGAPSPAERLDAACARLRAEPELVAFPARFSLFGATRMSTDQLAVLSALAETREIHLWLPHPSPAMWTELAGAPAAVSRSADLSGSAVRHPLLAGLARDVRELQQRLAATASDTYYPPASEDVVPERDTDSLLGALQAGIRDDRWPPAPRAADATVQVHACHGPARQVEVLRECLLGLFAADDTLEPRDVLVMCPEVEAYAPLVRAAFGQRVPGAVEHAPDSAHPAHRLRVRLADRGRGVTNPLLAVVGVLLELADGRVTVTQVLDLAAAETVRRRCGFDDDDIERLREWAAESGARWGIGQRQRQAFGLADFAQNTLNAAVDRILLGVTAGETAEAGIDGGSAGWLDLALPLDDVDSNDVDLAGRFAEFIDRLAVCLRDLRGPRPAHEWAAVLGRALDLLTDVPDSQSWVRTEARQELAAATEHAGDVSLRLADVEVLLRSRLAAAPTRANFRTGELTVCTMVPMRSVPHRVVVLLGLDDDVFPRAGGVDGDDVLAREPLLGERDPRSEDRQLLLDAILSATERLLVFHTGADPVTGAHRPPAIPVAELLDALRAHVGAAGMAEVVTRHPLQAFDRRNFRAERPFSFDTVALGGAISAGQPPSPRPAFLPEPLPAPELTDVALADLISFVEHPIRAFLWQRLGLRVPEHEEDIADRLPIELDGLAKWELGERLLTARLTGADPAGLRAAEWRRGTLPPFGFGAAVLDEVEHTVDKLVRASQGDYEGVPRAVDVAIDLGNGRRLTGTVPEVRGETLVRTTFSRLAPKHRISAWVSLLALAVTEDRSWRAVTTGRGQFGRPAWRSEITAPDMPAARAILRELVALRDAGLTEPLPITQGATAAYAERRFRGADAEEAVVAAEREFNGGPNGPGPFGDHTDRHLRYVWGPAPRLEHLMAIPAPPGEPGESTRFGALARRLWAPLLGAESQGQP
ncbi:DNA helicase/exodeoxyribonuclease V gamma subunit [Nocardia tenerifensis]|uniref:RecBCD enzyme subunit RecC n=3 Tax=Nocardia tenerifensis TaxID=228006 RepID=A0A318JSG2_9NOCA|nr:exodeoxyribonuclease V subunit gamma [Nocardia tenerifensis]PXX59144.1 DNA helicase/exodeoxyribonuclease V gamma subunit [Nocardia tenerifensis]